MGRKKVIDITPTETIEEIKDVAVEAPVEGDQVLENSMSLDVVRLIQNSGVEEKIANVFIEKFGDSIKQLANIKKRVDELVITREDQTFEIAQAKEAAKVCQKIRTSIEATRKDEKAYYLQAGKAIDEIAKVLQNIVEPIEEASKTKAMFAEIAAQKRADELRAERWKKISHLTEYIPMNKDIGYLDEREYELLRLGAQAMYDKDKEQERLAEEARLEEERKAEEARLAEIELLRREREEERKRAEEAEAKAKAEAEEAAKERARLEAEAAKIRAEAEAAAKKAAEEAAKAKAEAEAAAKKAAAEARMAAETAAAEARAKAEEEAKKAAEEARIAAAKAAEEAKARAEEEAREAMRRALEEERAAAERAAAEAEAARLAEIAEAERRAAAAPDKEKLMAYSQKISGIEFPELATEQGKAVLGNIKILMGKLTNYIQENVEKI